MCVRRLYRRQERDKRDVIISRMRNFRWNVSSERERDYKSPLSHFYQTKVAGRIASDPRKTRALTLAFELHALAESDKSREKINADREKS